MELRPATLDDADLLYRWRVQDENADWWNGSPVTRQGHRVWVADRLFSPVIDLWIVQNDGEPVGQVRSDSNGEISVSIAAEHRRRGYGQQALVQATRLAHEKHGRVKACVDMTNDAARALFRRAGYKPYDVEFLLWR